jgi:hypothetical protein
MRSCPTCSSRSCPPSSCRAPSRGPWTASSRASQAALSAPSSLICAARGSGTCCVPGMIWSSSIQPGSSSCAQRSRQYRPRTTPSGVPGRRVSKWRESACSKNWASAWWSCARRETCPLAGRSGACARSTPVALMTTTTSIRRVGSSGSRRPLLRCPRLQERGQHPSASVSSTEAWTRPIPRSMAPSSTSMGVEIEVSPVLTALPSRRCSWVARALSVARPAAASCSQPTFIAGRRWAVRRMRWWRPSPGWQSSVCPSST